MPVPKGKQPSKLSVDFSNVGDRTEGGRAARIPEGDCLLQPVAFEIRKKKDDPTSRYISWKMAIVAPAQYKNKGFIYYITSLKDESLWSLRNLLEDMGIKIPRSKVDLPLSSIISKSPVFGATVEDDDYNPEKIKSKIIATFPKANYEDTGEDSDDSDDDEDEDEEEEAPAPKKKAAKKPAATDEDDDDEESSDDDEEQEELELDDL